jgi:toxin YoeB
MQIVFLPKADEDLAFWVRSGNKQVLPKFTQLTKTIVDNPYFGIGKPEALKHEMAPKWSRRINKEHRYVYLVLEDTLYVFSLFGHYDLK